MKKEIITFLFAFLLSLVNNVISATTYNVTIDGIRYTINYVGAEHLNYAVVTGASCSGEIIIPASIIHSDYYDGNYVNDRSFKVEEIKSCAFCDRDDITSVVIGENIKSIGYRAFDGCSGLLSIFIPKGVTSMNSYDGSLFRGCSSLESIIVESGNKKYDSRDNCNALIETSTNKLMNGCKNTVIPSSVTSIGQNAFKNCVGLTSITIPQNVTTIGDRAFEGCRGLTSIIVEEGNSIFDSRDNCNAIIESSTNKLLVGCKSTVIPNTVTSIGSGAFSYSGIHSLTIPQSVVSLYASSFLDNELSSIVVESGNAQYDSRNNCNAIIETNTNTLVLGCGRTIIPFDVMSIGPSAFDGCSGLTSVTIPNSVTSIGNCAFSDCGSLTSVTIPGSVTSIGYGAFQRCNGLTSVISEIKEPFAFGSGAFYGISSNCTLKVPAGTKDAYIAKGWTEEVFQGGIIESIDVTDLSPLADAIYIESTEARCGSQATLSVKMKNSVAIQTLQFDLYLPDGITIVPNEDNELVTASKERINRFNYFQSSMQSDGALRLLAQATSTNIPAGDGEICRIVVDIPESMQEGDYPLIIRGALMVEKNNTSHSPNPDLVQTKLTLLRYVPGDASGDGEVNAIDFNIIGNFILGDSQLGINVKATDINGDGEVNAIDFNIVGNMILNGGGAAARMARTEEEKDPA